MATLLSAPCAEAASLRTVVVDPGHGGPSTGASGVASGRPESQHVLAIGLHLRDRLEEAGLRVVMTRSGDWLPHVPGCPDQLEARVAAAAAAGGDLFVSLHNNAYPQDPSVRGNMLFHRSGCRASAELARHLARALREVTGQPDLGTHPAEFRVLRLNPLPAAVLAEIGFLTNAADDWLLGAEAYRRQVALALARGIERYLGGVPAAKERTDEASAAVARAVAKTPPAPRKAPEPRRLEVGGRTLVNARDLVRLSDGTTLSHEGRLLLLPGGKAVPAVLIDGEPHVLEGQAAELLGPPRL